jgi:hypothetical protein
MQHFAIRLAFALSVYFLTATANAAIENDWQAGKQAFATGDIESALVFFETARDAGLEGPAVHYNIGVSQFKLGRYRDARQTFEFIARRFPQMRGLAEHNLGLIARRTGREADAREHFLNAHEFSPDDRTIRVLASRNLREIEPERRTASRWSSVVGLHGGYDDNIVLRDETGLPAGTTTESPMTDAFVSFSGPWNGQSGLRVEGSAYLVRYFDADDFDQSQVAGGVFYDWRPGDWRVQVGLHGSALTLGGDGYDRKIGGRLRVTRYLAGNSSIDLRVMHDEISEADSLYVGIQGDRQQVDARYNWYRDGHRLQLRYINETNNRLDPAVSPTRNGFALLYSFQPELGLGYEAGVSFRNSEYDELATPREEDLLTLRAGLSYKFRDNWLLMLDYQTSDNDSTDGAFSYDRSRLMLGAMKSF